MSGRIIRGLVGLFDSSIEGGELVGLGDQAVQQVALVGPVARGGDCGGQSGDLLLVGAVEVLSALAQAMHVHHGGNLIPRVALNRLAALVLELQTGPCLVQVGDDLGARRGIDLTQRIGHGIVVLLLRGSQGLRIGLPRISGEQEE